MKTFIILFVILGFIEIGYSPRLGVTEKYILIWYWQSGKRKFIKFDKIFLF